MAPRAFWISGDEAGTAAARFLSASQACPPRGRPPGNSGPRGGVVVEAREKNPGLHGISVQGAVSPPVLVVRAAILGGSVALGHRAGDTQEQHLRQDRHLGGAFDLDLVVVPIAEAREPIGFTCRFSCNHANRARGRIATIQRALRASEDFDLFDVEELRELSGGRVHVHVVVVNGDGTR